MDSIFLDTNAFRNPGGNNFFGKVDKIARIARLANICIPKMVIEEVKAQKRRHLISQLSQFKGNYFANYLGFEMGEHLDLHIEEQIDWLYENAQSEFNFIEYDINDKSCYDDIRFLAIQRLPPFEKGNDKGFKDACIYFTILHYKEEHNAELFLVTGGNRLKEAFKYDEDVVILKEIEEYLVYREDYFKEDYFVGKLRDHFLDENIVANDIQTVELNEEENWTIVLEVNQESQSIDVDFVSREIIE